MRNVACLLIYSFIYLALSLLFLKKYWESLDLCQFLLRGSSPNSLTFSLLDNLLLLPKSILIISHFAPPARASLFFQQGTVTIILNKNDFYTLPHLAMFFSPVLVGTYLNNLPTPVHKFETAFYDHRRDKLIKKKKTPSLSGQGEVES